MFSNHKKIIQRADRTQRRKRYDESDNGRYEIKYDEICYT